MSPRDDSSGRPQNSSRVNVTTLGPGTDYTPKPPEEMTTRCRERFRKGSLTTVNIKKCVVAACLVSLMFIVMSFLVGLGVLFVEILDTFQSSRAMASLLQSVCTGLVFGTGMFATIVIKKVGEGHVTTVGGLLAGIGCVGSAFAPSLPVLIFTVGVVTGCGLCTFTVVPYTVTGLMFNKRRNQVFIVVSIGPGLGGLISPFLNTALIDVFGWRGTFLVLAGLMFQACPIGMLLTVLSKDIQRDKELKAKSNIVYNDIREDSMVVTNLQEPSQMENSSVAYDNVTFVDEYGKDNNRREEHNGEISISLQMTDTEESKQDTNVSEMKDTKQKKESFVETLNLGLFKDFAFIVLGICLFILMSLLPSINFFFVDMTISKGFDAKLGSYLLSLIGLSNLGGRFLYLFVRPVVKVSQVTVFATMCMVLAGSLLPLVLANTYPSLVTAVVCYGIPLGSCSVAYPTLMYEIAGPKRYASAVGYCETICGLGAFLGGPIAGIVLCDITYIGQTPGSTCFGTSPDTLAQRTDILIPSENHQSCPQAATSHGTYRIEHMWVGLDGAKGAEPNHLNQFYSLHGCRPQGLP
ncbi:monocarboxylate transporter 1-like [Haliotis rubra]|uniref:monocarboxylate transporter 1-like n=1 Tax=Haliotis rubra TaxID=36100 RepID=UPI001EE61715|nr:monocarboxylate transporter 1-like [Haliotis rubra]